MPKPKLFIDQAPKKVHRSFHIGKDTLERYEKLRLRASECGLKLLEPSAICESAIEDAVRAGERELDERTGKVH